MSGVSGYIGAIVGDLGPGNDMFAGIPVSITVGTVMDGVRRPLLSGPGKDRSSGAATDLLDGAGSGDSLIGAGGEDILVGGPGADNLSGGAANERAPGRRGARQAQRRRRRDLCHGGGGIDHAKSCELACSIP